MKIIEFREFLQLQMEILDYLHSFCLEHNINYSLSGGSLLGAVRHQGFIPWDDDIDVMLLRDQYDKLRIEWNKSKHPYILHCLENNNSIGFSYGKISNPKTVVYEDGTAYMGVNIDVFPMDDIYDQEDYIKRKSAVLSVYDNIYKISVPNSNRTLRGLLKYYIYRLRFFNKKREDFAIEIDKIAREKNNCGCNYIFELVDGRIYKSFCNKTVADDYVDVPFEGKFYKAVKGYDEYLTSIFGDYMQLPPKEKQVSHHKFQAFWK